MEGTDGTYYIMSTAQIDNERFEKLVEQVKHDKTFDSVIKDDSYSVAKNFKPGANFLKYRFNVQFISPTKYL